MSPARSNLSPILGMDSVWLCDDLRGDGYPGSKRRRASTVARKTRRRKARRQRQARQEQRARRRTG